MNVAPVEVRCKGTYQGGPCRRFLGKLEVGKASYLCPNCGFWNNVEVDKLGNVIQSG